MIPTSSHTPPFLFCEVLCILHCINMHVQHIQLNCIFFFQKILDLYVSEVEQRLNQKQVLRQENQDVASLRPDESYFSRLDSSLKKNTAFVRKLVSITTCGCTAVLSTISLVLCVFFMK